jgi:hypothetical protein
MPTVDITAPATSFSPAAVGDAQDITSNFSISAGSSILTSTSVAPFVSGDTGKAFSLLGPGNSGPTGTWLFGTLTFVASNQVSLSVASTGTQSSTGTTRLIWGTDNGPAWAACNTWAQSQTSPITVTLGSGSKKFMVGAASDANAQRSFSLGYHLSQPITVSGNGSTTSILYSAASGFFLGCSHSIIKSGNGHFGAGSIFTARVNSATVGSTSLTCKTITDSSLFSSSTYALITGIDLQGFGNPPNPGVFEYVLMTNVSTATGVVSLSAPLNNTYLDSWPVYSSGTPGLQPDLGGPATLYVLDSFQSNITYQNLGVDQSTGGQTFADGSNVNFTNIKWFDGYGLTPSANGTLTCTNCDLTSYDMEFDKVVQTAIFDNTSLGQVVFQSGCLNQPVTFRNGCNVTRGLNGTPGILNINNSTVNGVSFGAISYGITTKVTAVGTTFTGTMRFLGVRDSGDITNTGIQVDYTMDRNVIKVPRNTAVRWAVPGTFCSFVGGPSGSITNGIIFQVLSVTEDANFTYVTTDWQYNGFPQVWGHTINVLGSPYLNFDPTTTGTDPQVANFVAANASGYFRPGTYTSITLNGSNMGFGGTSNGISMPVGGTGRLISFTINVTTPYTGVQGSLLYNVGGGQFANDLNVIAGDETLVTYNPVIDLKTAGTRIITTNGVTGQAGLDSGLALSTVSPSLGPFPKTWFSNWMNGADQMLASHNVVAEYNANPAIGPVFTITMITDQSLFSQSRGTLLSLNSVW